MPNQTENVSSDDVKHVKIRANVVVIFVDGFGCSGHFPTRVSPASKGVVKILSGILLKPSGPVVNLSSDATSHSLAQRRTRHYVCYYVCQQKLRVRGDLSI